jgi:lysozyme
MIDIPLDIAIDVSDAQGVIDWIAVRAAGIRIAFIKATEGDTFTAKTWDRNRSGATGAGIAVIPYHFLRGVPAARQVAHFCEATGLTDSMAYALDWEGRASQTCTPDVAETIGEELAKIANRPPIGYWGRPGATPALPTAKMQTWDEWVPRYPVSEAEGWGALPDKIRSTVGLYWSRRPDSRVPRFAQYTCWGRVNGIAGNVDRSIAMFPSADEAVAWVGAAQPAAPLTSGVTDASVIAKFRDVQSDLLTLRRYKGPVDGLIGTQTIAALRAAYDASR